MQAHYLFPAIVGLAGCSLLIDPQRKQCVTQEDCENIKPQTDLLVCGNDGYCAKRTEACNTSNDCILGQTCEAEHCTGNGLEHWSCWNSPPVYSNAAAQDTVQVQLLIQDALDSPVADMVIKACHDRDITCATPLAKANSNAQGEAQLEIPANLAVYYETEATEEYLGALTSHSRPASRSTERYNIYLYPIAWLDAFIAESPTGWNRELGVAVVRVNGCTGDGAEGMVLASGSTTAETALVYHLSSPVPNLVETQAGYGLGHITNLSPGPAYIDVKYGSTDQELIRASIVVRSESITTLIVN